MAKNNEIERLRSIEERYKKLYNIDNFQDENNFDLVVDTTNLKPEEIVDIILSKANV
jgi:cytidylate kinase